MENVFTEFMDNRRRHCGVSMNNERCRVMLSAARRLTTFSYDLSSLLPNEFSLKSPKISPETRET